MRAFAQGTSEVDEESTRKTMRHGCPHPPPYVHKCTRASRSSTSTSPEVDDGSAHADWARCMWQEKDEEADQCRNRQASSAATAQRHCSTAPHFLAVACSTIQPRGCHAHRNVEPVMITGTLVLGLDLCCGCCAPTPCHFVSSGRVVIKGVRA